jgi:hypothetical protein
MDKIKYILKIFLFTLKFFKKSKKKFPLQINHKKKIKQPKKKKGRSNFHGSEEVKEEDLEH